MTMTSKDPEPSTPSNSAVPSIAIAIAMVNVLVLHRGSNIFVELTIPCEVTGKQLKSKILHHLELPEFGKDEDEDKENNKSNDNDNDGKKKYMLCYNNAIVGDDCKLSDYECIDVNIGQEGGNNDGKQMKWMMLQLAETNPSCREEDRPSPTSTIIDRKMKTMQIQLGKIQDGVANLQRLMSETSDLKKRQEEDSNYNQRIKNLDSGMKQMDQQLSVRSSSTSTLLTRDNSSTILNRMASRPLASLKPWSHHSSNSSIFHQQQQYPEPPSTPVRMNSYRTQLSGNHSGVGAHGLSARMVLELQKNNRNSREQLVNQQKTLSSTDIIHEKTGTSTHTPQPLAQSQPPPYHSKRSPIPSSSPRRSIFSDENRHSSYKNHHQHDQQHSSISHPYQHRHIDHNHHDNDNVSVLTGCDFSVAPGNFDDEITNTSASFGGGSFAAVSNNTDPQHKSGCGGGAGASRTTPRESLLVKTSSGRSVSFFDKQQEMPPKTTSVSASTGAMPVDETNTTTGGRRRSERFTFADLHHIDVDLLNPQQMRLTVYDEDFKGITSTTTMDNIKEEASRRRYAATTKFKFSKTRRRIAGAIVRKMKPKRKSHK